MLFTDASPRDNAAVSRFARQPGDLLARVLLVYARGGVPPSYAIPKVAAVAEIDLLVVTPLPAPARSVAASCCSSVRDVSGERLGADQLVDRIVELANTLRVDAVLTLSEFATVPVARACERLGMPGPGPHAARARSKRRMRQAWKRAGVPVPRWCPVDTLDDLYAAWDQLSPPLLLKHAWSAAAVGQVMIRRYDEIPGAWEHSRNAVAEGGRVGFAELSQDAAGDFLVDEIIDSTTQSWYSDPRYGDHLSVEGLVVHGRYHPVCITSKAPTTAPFTERANFTPCVLDEQSQRAVERTARRAVDALELGTCGTHTELKLMAGGQVCLLETAARFGGVMLVREVETVYGVDMVGELTRAVLGEPTSLPARMLTGGGTGAAGSVAMYSMDSKGVPWPISPSAAPTFHPDRIDWSSLVSPGTRVEVVPDLTVPAGSAMPLYDAANGYLNSAGVLFLTAGDPRTLIADAYSVMDGLESAVRAAC